MWKHKNFINLQLCATFKHFYDAGTIGSGTVKFRHYSQRAQLATPQNVSANGTTVSWDAVENATSYAVIEGGNNVLGTVSASKLINFMIGSASYQAEEGMTWAQWVASSYNTRGFSIDSDGHIRSEYGMVYTDLSLTTYCNSTDKIIAGNEYGDSGSGSVGP